MTALEQLELTSKNTATETDFGSNVLKPNSHSLILLCYSRLFRLSLV